MKFNPPPPDPHPHPTWSSQFSKQEEIFGKIYILASALETQLMKKKITFIKIAPHKSIPLKIQVSICLCRHRLPPKQFCKSPPFKTSTPRYVEMWLLASPRYDLFSCNNFPQCVSAAKKLSEYVNPGFSYNFLHKYQEREIWRMAGRFYTQFLLQI